MADPVLDEKTDAYADAVIRAITETAAAQGEPDFNAALAALAYAEGYLLSALAVADRLKARAVLIDMLDRFTADFVNSRLLDGPAQGRG